MEQSFTRDQLILYQNKHISQLFTDSNPAKSKVINHLIQSLYFFMTDNTFSIQQKSVTLILTIPLIIKCLEKHVSMQKCKEMLTNQLYSQSEIFTKISPILKRHQTNLILKEITESFYSVYEFYLYIFDTDESIEIETVTYSREMTEKKLKNPVDVNGIAVLAPFVSPIKEPQKPTKKK